MGHIFAPMPLQIKLNEYHVHMGLAIHEHRQDDQLSMAPASAVQATPLPLVSAWFPSEVPNQPEHRQNSERSQMRASKVCYSGLRYCISLSFP